MYIRNKLIVYREITRVERVFRSGSPSIPVEARKQTEEEMSGRKTRTCAVYSDCQMRQICEISRPLARNGGPAGKINLRITSSGLKRVTRPCARRESYINRPGRSKFSRFSYVSCLYTGCPTE